MLTTSVICLSSFIVLACCAVLVFHSDYHAGVLGTFGLSLLGIGAMLRISDLGHSPFSPLAILVWTGMACFFGRLTWNFLARSRRRDGTWYKPPNGREGA